MSVPFAWVYVCFASGIVSASYLHTSSWLLGAACLCAAASLVCSSYKLGLSAQMLFLFLLANQSTSCMEIQYENDLRDRVRTLEREAVSLQGWVLQTPEIAEDYFVLRVQITSLSQRPVKGVARLTVSTNIGPYPVAGDFIETFAHLRLPVNFRSEGSLDYERYLKKEGIHVLGSVKHPRLVHITHHRNGLKRFMSRLRLKLILRIMKSFSPGDSSLLRALWLDDRTGLSLETREILIDAGIFHVVAISGFHVGVLATLSFLMLKRILSFRKALVLICLLLLFYFLLLEGRSSITRSFLTFVILALAHWRFEKVSWANVLFCSAFIQLLLNPLEIFDSGYHLTYLSTAAILFVAVPFCTRIRMPRRFYQLVFNFIIVLAAIQFVLAPYQAFVFHKISFASLVANFFAIPVSSALITAGLIYAPFSSLHPVLISLTHHLIRLFMDSSSLFSSLWVTTVTKPSFLHMVCFYLSLTLMLLLKNKWMRFISAGITITSLALIFGPFIENRKDFLRVHFMDVGQGDAILLEYPNGAFDLIDGGGTWNPEALDIGEAVLLPYLSIIKVKRLNRVFLTHAHADHMNGLISLLRYIPVGNLYLTRRPCGDPGYQKLIAKIDVIPKAISAGAEFREGSVLIKALSPTDSHNTLRVQNDDSLVLGVEYAGKRILFAGDVEAKTEKQLCNRPDLKFDFVKVPHHGSKSSSSPDFLNRLKMKMAFISVGRGNWFGHPHPEVTSRYRERHALIYRTDELGSIRLTIRPDEHSVDSFVWSQ